MNTRYGVILADPPWRYRNAGIDGAAEAQYPTMSIDELCALPIGDLAKPDAVLLLWATWPQVQDALEVVRAWGFEYVTGFPYLELFARRQRPGWDVWGNEVQSTVELVAANAGGAP